MNILVDTNILVRLSEPSNPDHMVCLQAVRRLERAGDALCLCAQAAIEFWSVATRPQAVNGLGFHPAKAEEALRAAEGWTIWLPEPPDIGRRWRVLVNKHDVRGRQVHDARLAAFMNAHGIVNLLTLNAADFARFPGVTCLSPATVK